MHSISECWRLFEEHLPVGVELPSGAGEPQLDAAQNELGHPLSPDLREFFRIHDGTGGVYFFPFEIGNGEHVVLSLEDGIKHLKRQRARYSDGPQEPYCGPDWKPPFEVKSICWHESWLPFTDNGCGDGMFVDFAPQPAGSLEQVVDWWHEGAVTTLIADNVVEWFNELVRKLDDGTYQLAVSV